MEVIVPLAMMLLIGWYFSRKEDKENARKELERKHKRESDPFCDAERLRQELLRWMTGYIVFDNNIFMDSSKTWKTKKLSGFNRVLIDKTNPFCISVCGDYYCDDEQIKKLGHSNLLLSTPHPTMLISCDLLTSFSPYSGEKKLECCIYFHEFEFDAALEKLGIRKQLSLNLDILSQNSLRLYFYNFPSSSIRKVLREPDPQKRFSKLTDLIESTCRKIDMEFRKLGFVTFDEHRQEIHLTPKRSKLPQ